MLKYIIEIIIGIIIMILIFAATSCGEQPQPEKQIQPTQTQQSPQDTVPYLWNNGTGEWVYEYEVLNNNSYRTINKVVFHEEYIDVNGSVYVGSYSPDGRQFKSGKEHFSIKRKILIHFYNGSNHKRIYVNP